MSVIAQGQLPRSHYIAWAAVRYCTTTFTVASWPPMESFRGCVPVGASAGIDTFTWYNATMPGVKPLKNGVRAAPNGHRGRHLSVG